MTHASKQRTRVDQSPRKAAPSPTRARTQWQQHWLVQLVPDLLILASFAAALIFLFNRWWSIPVALRPGGPVGQFLDLLTALGLMPPIGFVAFVVTAIIAARRLRWRVNHTRFLRKSHCPRCGSHDLQRTPRKPIERRIANMGIPLRRYICVDCHWRGPRIEGMLVPD